jgi:hypothetical protein
VRVVKRIKEIVRITPREIVLDLWMNVRLDSCVCLLVIALECQEIGATLAQDLRSNGGLTAHRINGDNAACDGEQMEQGWKSRDLVRLLARFDLAYNETALIRTPC